MPKNRKEKKIKSTEVRKRLTVYKSNKHIYVQLIDDSKGHTLISSSSLKLTIENATKIKKAELVGQDIAIKAKNLKIKNIVFDRGHHKYIGRVKVLADAARELGLNF